MHGGEQWRAVMYVGYGSSSCCSRQLVPHTPVGAHNVTMTCEHLWQHRVGTTYYIGSLYYKRLAARKGGATLDAPSTTLAASAFPKRCLPNPEFTHARSQHCPVILSCVPRNFTRVCRYRTIFQGGSCVLTNNAHPLREERAVETNITSNDSILRKTPRRCFSILITMSFLWINQFYLFIK